MGNVPSLGKPPSPDFAQADERDRSLFKYLYFLMAEYGSKPAMSPDDAKAIIGLFSMRKPKGQRPRDVAQRLLTRLMGLDYRNQAVYCAEMYDIFLDMNPRRTHEFFVSLAGNAEGVLGRYLAEARSVQSAILDDLEVEKNDDDAELDDDIFKVASGVLSVMFLCFSYARRERTDEGKKRAKATPRAQKFLLMNAATVAKGLVLMGKPESAQQAVDANKPGETAEMAWDVEKEVEAVVRLTHAFFVQMWASIAEEELENMEVVLKDEALPNMQVRGEADWSSDVEEGEEVSSHVRTVAAGSKRMPLGMFGKSKKQVYPDSPPRMRTFDDERGQGTEATVTTIESFFDLVPEMKVAVPIPVQCFFGGTGDVPHLITVPFVASDGYTYDAHALKTLRPATLGMEDPTTLDGHFIYNSVFFRIINALAQSLGESLPPYTGPAVVAYQDFQRLSLPETPAPQTKSFLRSMAAGLKRNRSKDIKDRMMEYLDEEKGNSVTLVLRASLFLDPLDKQPLVSPYVASDSLTHNLYTLVIDRLPKTFAQGTLSPDVPVIHNRVLWFIMKYWETKKMKTDIMMTPGDVVVPLASWPRRVANEDADQKRQLLLAIEAEDEARVRELVAAGTRITPLMQDRVQEQELVDLYELFGLDENGEQTIVYETDDEETPPPDYIGLPGTTPATAIEIADSNTEEAADPYMALTPNDTVRITIDPTEFFDDALYDVILYPFCTADGRTSDLRGLALYDRDARSGNGIFFLQYNVYYNRAFVQVLQALANHFGETIPTYTGPTVISGNAIRDHVQALQDNDDSVTRTRSYLRRVSAGQKRGLDSDDEDAPEAKRQNLSFMDKIEQRKATIEVSATLFLDPVDRSPMKKPYIANNGLTLDRATVISFQTNMRFPEGELDVDMPFYLNHFLWSTIQRYHKATFGTKEDVLPPLVLQAGVSEDRSMVGFNEELFRLSVHRNFDEFLTRFWELDKPRLSTMQYLCATFRVKANILVYAHQGGYLQDIRIPPEEKIVLIQNVVLEKYRDEMLRSVADHAPVISSDKINKYNKLLVDVEMRYEVNTSVPASSHKYFQYETLYQDLKNYADGIDNFNSVVDGFFRWLQGNRYLGQRHLYATIGEDGEHWLSDAKRYFIDKYTYNVKHLSKELIVFATKRRSRPAEYLLSKAMELGLVDIPTEEFLGYMMQSNSQDLVYEALVRSGLDPGNDVLSTLLAFSKPNPAADALLSYGVRYKYPETLNKEEIRATITKGRNSYRKEVCKRIYTGDIKTDVSMDTIVNIILENRDRVGHSFTCIGFLMGSQSDNFNDASITRQPRWSNKTRLRVVEEALGFMKRDFLLFALRHQTPDDDEDYKVLINRIINLYKEDSEICEFLGRYVDESFLENFVLDKDWEGLKDAIQTYKKRGETVPYMVSVKRKISEMYMAVDTYVVAVRNWRIYTKLLVERGISFNDLSKYVLTIGHIAEMITRNKDEFERNVFDQLMDGGAISDASVEEIAIAMMDGGCDRYLLERLLNIKNNEPSPYKKHFFLSDKTFERLCIYAAEREAVDLLYWLLHHSKNNTLALRANTRLLNLVLKIPDQDIHDALGLVIRKEYLDNLLKAEDWDNLEKGVTKAFDSRYYSDTTNNDIRMYVNALLKQGVYLNVKTNVFRYMNIKEIREQIATDKDEFEETTFEELMDGRVILVASTDELVVAMLDGKCDSDLLTRLFNIDDRETRLYDAAHELSDKTHFRLCLYAAERGDDTLLHWLIYTAANGEPSMFHKNYNQFTNLVLDNIQDESVHDALGLYIRTEYLDELVKEKDWDNLLNYVRRQKSGRYNSDLFDKDVKRYTRALKKAGYTIDSTEKENSDNDEESEDDDEESGDDDEESGEDDEGSGDDDEESEDDDEFPYIS